MSLVWLGLGIPWLRGPLLYPQPEFVVSALAKTSVGAAFAQASEDLRDERDLSRFIVWWRLAEMRLAWDAMDANLAIQLELSAGGSAELDAADRGRWHFLQALEAERAGDYRGSIEHLANARELLLLTKDERLLGVVCEQLGRNRLVVARFEEANEALAEAALHYEAAGDPCAVARTWIATSGSSTQSIEQRLAGPLDARAVFEKAGDLSQLAVAMVVSGYEAFEDPIVSEEAFREALSLATQTGHREAALHARLGLAEVLLFTGGVRESIDLIAEIEGELSPAAPVPLRAAVLRVSGYTAAFAGDPSRWESGLSKLRTSADLFEAIGDRESLQFAHLCGGELLLEMQRPDEATEVLLAAVGWMRAQDSRFLIEALSLLELAYVKRGLFEEAYHTLAEYTDVREAQYEVGMKAELAALTDQHLATLRQIQLENLRTNQALQNSEITAQAQRVALLEAEHAREGMIRQIALGGLGLSVCVSLVFGYLYRNKRRAESRVKELNAHLVEDKVILQSQSEQLQEQNLQLAQVNGRFKELDEERKRVLGIAAHEMRNPLSAMESTFELLELELGSMRGGATSPLRDIIDVGWEGARSLRALVDRVLAARSDETLLERLQLRPLALRAVLHQVILLNELHAARKGIAVHLEGGHLPAVMADAQACREVFDNLLSNALKFSPPEGQIRIIPRVIEEDRLEIRVEDQGPGIPAAERERIFQPFGKTSHRPTGGESATGLGLSTVKDLVAAMRGSVWLEDAIGGGAVFVVTLPAAGSGLIPSDDEARCEETRKKDCPAPTHA